MPDLMHWLRVAAASLTEAGAHYAVVGGLAVGVRCQPRFTQDVDLAVAVSADDEAERIAFHLLHSGFALSAELDRQTPPRVATMRFVPPGAAALDDAEKPLLVDLLFCACGIEPEVVAAATPYRFTPRIRLPVAQVAHLLAMKVLSVRAEREKDLVDLRALLEIATASDLKTARHLLKLVIARGFHEDRDLLAEFKQHLQERGPKRRR